ncbi:hypothetical protein [Novosphingobium sp. Leaf2]|uniref:hypothetical protein n=1 Tax=Novosphingobium sp. Leaf2 TaxID=1735670 RepID=UPI0006FAF1A9|nr:hypothetical protein [Novosphingobium sp. Leaf2]KQM14701.1 hypothetical protein ASE49_11035 [Novosphingobium sp. Leaf2]
MDAILYGECVGESDMAAAPVRISRLADQGCDLIVESAAGLFDTDFSLWIGAVGPLAAVAAKRSGRNVEVRFKQPLDARILRHFNV